ncbi:MAG TPA: hypothetical protein VF439_01980 [Candidatus Paceibacterota bacterium]
MAKKSNNGKIAAEVGAGLAAAGAAAAAGYYFYGSDKAKQHRRVASKWAGDMQKQVVRETKKLGKVSAADVARIVDVATVAYGQARSIDPSELQRAAAELKKNWELVRREAIGDAKRARTTAKKVRTSGVKARAAVKKTAKKVRKAAGKVRKAATKKRK